MTLTLEQAYTRAQAKARLKRCAECRHAIVQHGEKCRCERGHWYDATLAEVCELREDCGTDFEAS